MNGFGTVRTRPLPTGFLATGWADCNLGENQVCTALSALGIKVAFSGASRDAWLRGQGWLTFRVDTGKQRAVEAQVARIVGVVRALART